MSPFRIKTDNITQINEYGQTHSKLEFIHPKIISKNESSFKLSQVELEVISCTVSDMNVMKPGKPDSSPKLRSANVQYGGEHESADNYIEIIKGPFKGIFIHKSDIRSVDTNSLKHQQRVMTEKECFSSLNGGDIIYKEKPIDLNSEKELTIKCATEKELFSEALHFESGLKKS